MNNIFKILLFIVLPILYFVFRTDIVAKWNDIESALAIIGYITSLYFYTYNTDIKFHFFILRIVNYFRYDHTTWKVSFRASTIKNDKEIIEQLSTKLAVNNNIIKAKTDNSLELMINNNFLLNISFSQDKNINSAFAFTSNIVIPTRQSKLKTIELTKLLETIEESFEPIAISEKEYSIDVEYNSRSPYYSYWIKKLPEEMIHNFNCSVTIPENLGSKIKVNKNHIIISSNSLTNLFNLTKDFINLQPL